MKHDSKRKKVLPDNIPKESRESLNEMKIWKNKVIRPADKGSKFFIIDREDYINRVEVCLNDETTFDKFDNKEQLAVDAIKQWTIKYCEEPGMTVKMMSSFLNPDDSCKPGNNYVNPKAHKPSQI